MLFSGSDVASATDGVLFGNSEAVQAAAIDSRQISAGQLFVPIVAERDGHDFVTAAVNCGARIYLSSRGELDDRVARVEVADTAKALLGLGAAARRRISGPVIGITGSTGKTSVKDLTSAACREAGVVHANPASFNNELGVPLTLFNTPDDVDVTILEMGSRGIGHISALCEIAKPNVGIVTNVGMAHTELFGSLANVAAGKGELIEALPPSGTAVLNADDPLVAAMAQRSNASVITFGASASADAADVMVSDVLVDDMLRPRFLISTPNGSVRVRLAVAGAHMALNAAAALAAALAVGVSLEDAAAGIESATLSPMRMQLSTLASGARLINDAYNANPASMAAALAALAALSHTRKVAILGVMAELGPSEGAAHEQVAAAAVAANIEVVAVDAELYGRDATHVTTPEQAVAVLGDTGAATAILIKGSQVAELERVAGLLS